MIGLIHTSVDEKTARYLNAKSRELGRSVDDLARTAIEEYALQMMKHENWKDVG